MWSTTDMRQKPTVNVRHDVSTHRRTEFDPREFVASTDTLYALSMEGPGSAAALMTAMIGQNCGEATALASKTPERVYPTWKTRMVAEVACSDGEVDSRSTGCSPGRSLDEATSTALLKDLPKQCSHFGGRGIIPISILQNPEQDTDMWGPGQFKGMQAGAVHYYGGNVSTDDYMQSLSNRVGNHEILTTTRNTGRGGRRIIAELAGTVDRSDLHSGGAAERTCARVLPRKPSHPDQEAVVVGSGLRRPDPKVDQYVRGQWRPGRHAHAGDETDDRDGDYDEPESISDAQAYL